VPFQTTHESLSLTSSSEPLSTIRRRARGARPPVVNISQ
jgi:hypothetical protein